MKKILFYLLLVVSIVIIVGSPVLIWMYSQNVSENTVFINHFSDWMSFGGSYLGGIFGGLCTLVGVLITLVVTKAEASKPFLVVDYNETKTMIYDPERYSETNKLDGPIQYNRLPSISDLCEMGIVNSGKGNAKDIDVVMYIRQSDVLLTDINRMMLELCTRTDENFGCINGNYVQKTHFPFLENEGGEKVLWIGTTLNGILFSSIWNISYFLNFTEKDFSKDIDTYYKKKSSMPITIPEIIVLLEYKDLNDKKYKAAFRLELLGVEQWLGEGVLVKPKIVYEKERKFKKYKKEIKGRIKKEKRINYKEKQLDKKWQVYSGYVYEVAMKLGMTDEEAIRICCDSVLKRYFYNYLKKGHALRRELIICFLFCCVDNGIDIKYRKKMFDTILEIRENMVNNKKIRWFRYKEAELFEKKDREEIKSIIGDTDKLCKEYFTIFEKLHKHAEQEIVISKNQFNIKIPMNNEMRTECGFFRKGYSYRMVSNQKSIGSVIQHKYNNIEIGFLDERGIYYDKELRWDCIYLR